MVQVVASLVSTILQLPKDWDFAEPEDTATETNPYDLIDGFSDEQVYLQGMFAVNVISHSIDTVSRRVQGHPPTCRRAFAWQDRETVSTLSSALKA